MVTWCAHQFMLPLVVDAVGIQAFINNFSLRTTEVFFFIFINVILLTCYYIANRCPITAIHYRISYCLYLNEVLPFMSSLLCVCECGWQFEWNACFDSTKTILRCDPVATLTQRYPIFNPTSCFASGNLFGAKIICRNFCVNNVSFRLQADNTS